MAHLRYVLAASAICLGIAGFSVVARASDAGHEFAVRGIGAEQCSTFTQPTEQASPYQRFAVENWLLGYITAENRILPGTYDVLALQDPQIIPNLVDVLCKANPKASVETVSAALLKRLEPIKIVHESPLLSISLGSNNTKIRQATLALVEKSLENRKYYHGKTTGKFNKELQDALIKFQREQSLPQTGIPDSATIIRLLIELPSKK